MLLKSYLFKNISKLQDSQYKIIINSNNSYTDAVCNLKFTKYDLPLYKITNINFELNSNIIPSFIEKLDENELSVWLRISQLSGKQVLKIILNKKIFFSPIDVFNYNIDNLAAYWDFEKIDNGIVYDKSGNNHNGTIYYNITLSEGKYGNGLYFNKGYIDIGLLNPGTSSFSGCIWIKNPLCGRIICHDNYEQSPGLKGDWALSLCDPGANKLRFYYRGAIITNLDTSELSLNDGNWHFLAFTRNINNGNRKIYHFNNVVASLTNDTYIADGSNTSLTIGGETDSSYESDRIIANLDEPMIFTKELSQNDINALVSMKYKTFDNYKSQLFLYKDIQFDYFLNKNNFIKI